MRRMQQRLRLDAPVVTGLRRRLVAGMAVVVAASAGGWTLPVRAQGADPLPALIARTKPSVIAVGAYDALQTPRFAFRGTGFVVTDGNHAITNAHVLPERAEGASEAPRLVVLIPSKSDGPQVREAKVVEVDRSRDLALLSFEGPPLSALPLAPSTPVDEGRDVVLIGFPIGGILGFSHVTHRGIIASVTSVAPPPPTSRQLAPQAVHRIRQGTFDVYQLDAVAYPGNSGGPLLDVQTGQVVGVINMVLVKGSREAALTSPTGITYAIPVAYVDALITASRRR